VSLEQLDLKFPDFGEYSIDINISVSIDDFIAPHMEKITALAKQTA